ncbi:MAG: amidohydrolase family protein [Porticoccus sp.]|nr:amidohydrolase family protein [Porticoccus sp.]
MLDQLKIFDSHFHIIDHQFPLVPNNGYLPSEFTYQSYLDHMTPYDLCGGAVVSGSFQVFDQSYLVDALAKLGPSFVGVTQLPVTASDDEIIQLNKVGVRAVRFNLKRGGSESIGHLTMMAKRIHELVNWHVELYVDSKELPDLYDTLIALPSVSIDHLGLSQAGLGLLIKLAEKGVRVKATGFGRVDFDVKCALKDLYSANPASLLFGTDLPSTRAPTPYSDNGFLLVIDALGEDGARNVLSRNALNFYNPQHK